MDDYDHRFHFYLCVWSRDRTNIPGPPKVDHIVNGSSHSEGGTCLNHAANPVTHALDEGVECEKERVQQEI